MKEINKQPALGRINLWLIRLQLCLRNGCSYCKNGILYILIDILDLRGVSTNKSWLSFQHLSIFQ